MQPFKEVILRARVLIIPVSKLSQLTESQFTLQKEHDVNTARGTPTSTHNISLPSRPNITESHASGNIYKHHFYAKDIYTVHTQGYW